MSLIFDPVRSKPSGADKQFHISTATESKLFRLRCGSQWLHWSGLFFVEKRTQAWTGTIDQARNIRRSPKFPAAHQCKAVRFEE